MLKHSDSAILVVREDFNRWTILLDSLSQSLLLYAPAETTGAKSVPRPWTRAQIPST